MRKTIDPSMRRRKLSSLDANEYDSLNEEELARDPDYALGYAARRAVIEAGELVSALRAARGITRAELAERSGVSQEEISEIERAVGRYGPTVATLGRLDAALRAEPPAAAEEGSRTGAASPEALSDGSIVRLSGAESDAERQIGRPRSRAGGAHHIRSSGTS